MIPLTHEPQESERFCWFHGFEHPFDGISNGWVCEWQPVVVDGELKVRPHD